MSERQNHIIKSCQFEFSMDDPVNAINLPDNLKNLVVTDIMPKLSLAFNDLVGPDEVLSIDALEIDLGVLQNKTIETDFRQSLNTHLIRGIKEFKTVNGVFSVKSWSIEQTFHYFLENGALPWNAMVQNLKELEKAYMQIQSPDMAKLLSALLGEFAQTRFIRQFSSQFKKSLLLNLMTESSIMKDLKPKVAALSDLGLHQNLPDLIKVLVYFYHADKRGEHGNAPLDLKILDSLEKEDFRELLKTISKSVSDESISEFPEDFYVQHSGMVLVHPFLSHLFSHLDLDLKSKMEDRVRAVHLLYFMATAQIQPEEHECGFLKLLCGLDMNFPIPKEIILSPHEKEESLACLEAMIQHWDKLGNTSVDGLRQSFLSRSGKLTFTKQNTTLIVEGQSLDILLDFMPWTIASIKLPWMLQTLKVDWA